MYISEETIINVTQNVITITFVILSVYPVVFIIREMVNFVSGAFHSIPVEKAFKVPTLKGVNDTLEK